MASCHYCSGDNGHLQHVLFLTQLPPLSPSHVSMADSSSVTLTEWSGDLRSTAGTSIDDVVVVDSSEEKVDPMQWLMQALPMKQMKEQVSSLFFHHCVTGDKQQQGMRPVIVLHFLLLLLVIISLCWLICVFFSLGMATVLFLMFKPCHKLRDFWKTLQLWDGNSCHHYVYRRGEPLILHSEALTAKLLRYFLLIANLWLKETSLSLSSSVACRSKIVTEVASI